MIYERQKVCLECEKPIHGRSDKKYCSDSCRNAFNNKLNAPSTNYIRNVNNILGRNRRILLGLNPKGKLKVHRDSMLKMGFDFNYYTNSYTNRVGDQYLFCYDQGYLILDEGYVLLVKSRT
jgi:hypothetical protein